MKKYITIAALVVASVIITAVALNSAEPQATGPPTPAMTDDVVYEPPPTPSPEDAELIRLYRMDFTGAQPVKRPDVFVKTETITGREVVTVFTKEGELPSGRLFRPFTSFEKPEEYQPGMARLVTPISESYRDFHVYVMTSTDLTNWYPVSYGEKYPESKQPRYFKLWTEIDEGSFYIERAKKRREEFLKKQGK